MIKNRLEEIEQKRMRCVWETGITQEVDNSGKLVLVYHTDLAIEIPEGYCGLLMMKRCV